MSSIPWPTTVEETSKIRLFIPVKPEPQERVRIKFRGWGKNRRASAYYPDKTRNYQEYLRVYMQAVMNQYLVGQLPKDVPLYLKAVFVLPRPKTVTVKKRPFPIGRPDLSNYLKSLEDGIQSVKDQISILPDDSAIIDIHIQKQYTDEIYPSEGIDLEIGIKQ